MIKEVGKIVKGFYFNKGMYQYVIYFNEVYVDVNVRIEMDFVKSDWYIDGFRLFNVKIFFLVLFFIIFGKMEQGMIFEFNIVFKYFDVFYKYFNYFWLGMFVNMFFEVLKFLKFFCVQFCL